MEKKFNAGDPVKLKSGSSKMTVIMYNENNKVVGSWMVKDERKEEAFYEVELRKWKRPRGYSVG